MEIIEISLRIERKLKEQTSEFNILRNRVFVVAGFGIALLTMIFSVWGTVQLPYTYFVLGAALISFISISIMLYAAFTNELDRGMNTKFMKQLIEDGINEKEKINEFFLNDISYNLDSFETNSPKLRSLQYKLNCGIISQASVSLLIGFSMYFNSI